MKNIYIILFLAFGLQTYAQKTIYIYNLSSTDFLLWDIGTQDAASTFPVFMSSPSGGIITIAPGEPPYIVEADPSSTSKFPFYSPSSSPVIDYWTRTSAPDGPHATLPSNLVATVYGATQILEHVKSQVGPGGSLGGRTLFPTAGNGYSDLYTFSSRGVVSLDIIDQVDGPQPDGETYIFITD